MPQSITCTAERFFRRKTSLSEGSVKMYRRVIGYLVDCFGDVEMASVTVADVDDFIDFLQRRQVGLKKQRPISGQAVNSYLRHARAFFAWAAKRSGQASVFDGVEFVDTPRKKRCLFEDGEIVRLLAACSDDRWRLIVALAAFAGLRSGEILNLTVAEIDFLAGVIEIRPKVDAVQTWAWQIKDKESRTLPITSYVEGLLLRVLSTLPVGQPYVLLEPERYRRLIELKDSGQLNYELKKCPENNFKRTFRAVCRRAQVPYRKFHTLRASFCTRLAEKGLPVHEVAELAGHASVSTTLTYYQAPRNGYLARAKEALEMGDPGLEPRTR